MLMMAKHYDLKKIKLHFKNIFLFENKVFSHNRKVYLENSIWIIVDIVENSLRQFNILRNIARVDLRYFVDKLI